MRVLHAKSAVCSASRSRSPSLSSLARLVSRVFQNILASNAVIHHGDDQNLAAVLRFENAANIRTCHSNQPCHLLAREPSVSWSLLQTLYTCQMPHDFQAFNRNCLTDRLCFSQPCNYFLLLPTGWAALHSLINIAAQLLRVHLTHL